MNARRLLAFLAVAALILLPSTLAAQEQERAHFHHVHLNVTNPQKTIEYYKKVFSGVPVKFRGVSDAIMTERSFILMTKVNAPPPSELDYSIWHIGWSAVDTPTEYEWWKSQGIKFQTPLTRLGVDRYYTYLYGEDKEVLEICCGGTNHKFNHLHLLVYDVNKTREFFTTILGLPPLPPVPTTPPPQTATTQGSRANAPAAPAGAPGAAGGARGGGGGAGLRVDNVGIATFAVSATANSPIWLAPPLKEIKPSKGRPIDHLAFSYKKIEPVFDRLKKAGINIVEPISMKKEYNLKSFFILSPDNLLIEIVEAGPIPEGIWEK